MNKVIVRRLVFICLLGIAFSYENTFILSKKQRKSAEKISGKVNNAIKDSNKASGFTNIVPLEDQTGFMRLFFTATPSSSPSATSSSSPSLSPSPSATTSPRSTSSASPTVTPTYSSSNTPSKSPSPSPGIFSNLPITEEAFNTLTLRTGSGKEDSGFLETEDGFPIEGRYEFTIVPEGVVSMRGASDIIENILCEETGSITVQMKSQYVGRTGSLGEMYPKGSIVSVDPDIFGRCRLKSSETPEYDFYTDQDSGYLRVQSVSGTRLLHTIQGEVVEFMDMFESATFELKNFGTSSSTNTGTTSRILSEADSLHTSGKQLSWKDEYENTLWESEDGDVKLTSKIELSAEVNMADSIDRKEGDQRVRQYGGSIELGLSGEIAFEYASTATLFKPENDIELLKLIDIPIRGVVIKTFSFSSFQFESYRIGFFYTVPIIWQPEILLEVSWKVPVKIAMTTGKKVFAAEVITSKGKLPSASMVDLPGGTPASIDFPTPPIANIFQPQMDIVFKNFLGLVPTLSFEFPGFRSGISKNMGFQVDVKGSLNLNNPYVPVKEGDVLAFRFGDCDSCHLFQGTFDVVVGNINFFVEVAEERVYEKGIRSPISKSFKFGALCLLESSLTTLCGDSCCPNALTCDRDNVCGANVQASKSASATPSTVVLMSPSSSTSPSALASASASVAISPSASTTIVSATLTPSISPSSESAASPSVSVSPSISPSSESAASPSVSISQSISPSSESVASPSVSISQSISPSSEPAASPSVSISASVSPATSTSSHVTMSAAPSESATASGSQSSSPETDPLVEAVCTEKPLLKKNDGFSSVSPEKRDYVRGLQILLNFKVPGLSIDEDGLFGSGTEDAVEQFQNQAQISVDGIVGTNTWNELCQAPLPTV